MRQTARSFAVTPTDVTPTVVMPTCPGSIKMSCLAQLKDGFWRPIKVLVPLVMLRVQVQNEKTNKHTQKKERI